MEVATKLAGLMTAWYRKTIKNVGRRWEPGAPPWIESEELSEICRRCFGSAYRVESHLHLSGWKIGGAYRLRVEAASGDGFNVIFKDAVYDSHQVPEVHKFPVRPGKGEYLLYREPTEKIQKYLPKIFWLREVEAGRHYQYLIEDLSADYRPLNSLQLGGRGRAAIGDLIDVHDALREWGKRQTSGALPRYDAEYSQRLQDRAQTICESYARRYSKSMVALVASAWGSIGDAHSWASALVDDNLEFIHGDANRANILVGRSDRRAVKLIDWEWVGIGLPHTDLAAMFKGNDARRQEEALRAFIANRKTTAWEEHAVLYAWARLNRAICDIAYLGPLAIEGNHGQGTSKSHQFINRAAERVAEGYSALVLATGMTGTNTKALRPITVPAR